MVLTKFCFDAFSRARQGFGIQYLELTHSKSRLIRLLLSRIMRDQRSCDVTSNC